jgi:hypothetical protein
VTAVADDDEMTELVDADFPRVDLVGKGANGIPRFLIAKQDGDSRGLIPPEMVRELIGKQADPEPERDTVTMTGSPAAIAKLMQEGALRFAKPADGVAKAKVSTADKNDHPDSDFAYIESGGHKDESGRTTPRSKRHFLIHDAAHVRNALARIAQGAAFGKEALPKVKAAARKFGIDVSKEAHVAEAVTKADVAPDLDDGVDGLDPTVPLAEPDEMGSGSPTDPGSPAWESIDAATAQKWCSILARAKAACGLLAERELLEAAAGDDDDAGKAYDLQDACCAIDFAISVLAPFAVAEQAEADCGDDEMAAMVGKSAPDPVLSALEGGILAVIRKAAEALERPVFDLEVAGAVIRKSGRVLSAVNEAHLREAAQRLTTVLSSLPQAPATDDGRQVAKQEGAAVDGTQTDAGTEVAKGTPSAEEQARDTGPVQAGGTTGMGEPRATGPADALPGDGPQKTLPGDVPGRTVIKAAALPVGVFDHAQRILGLADPAAILTDIAKADGEKTPMCVVYDQKGRLIGIVDPSDITPVSNAEAEPDEAPDADGDGSDGDAGDMTPAPAATVGTPADAVQPDGTVTKSQQEPDAYAVLKSAVREAVAELIGSRGPAEGVAKQADVAGLLEEVETLKARLATVEEHPAAPGVFAHGATPPPGSVPPARPSLRGQDQGASAHVDVAKAAEMRRQFANADPAEQNRLASQMQQAAIDHLAALHAAG